jgi:hypothetical protein
MSTVFSQANANAGRDPDGDADQDATHDIRGLVPHRVHSLKSDGGSSGGRQLAAGGDREGHRSG